MANNRFNLELDTIAPTGSITRPAEYIKTNRACTINKGDATHMYAWFDKVAAPTAKPEGQALVVAAETLTPSFSASGIYYGHVILVDEVRNESEIYSTERIVFDNQIPTIGTAEMSDTDSGSKTLTNDRTVNYSFTCSDNLAGVTKAVLTGPFTGSPLTINNPAATQTGTLSLTGADGLKTVSIVVTDAADNSSTAKTMSITLDLTQTKPVTTLLTADETSLPEFINYHAIKVNLKDSDKDIVGYKIWEKGQTKPTSYTELTAGTAVDVTVDLILSTGDGLKTVCAETVDVAGTPALADEVSVTIDSVPATATLTGPGTWISNVTGFTSANIHIVVNDGEVGAGKQSGIKSYVVKCNGSAIETGSEAVDKDITITSATAGIKEGNNDFTLDVVDIAENTSSASKEAGVKLDTTPATASITALNTWYNEFHEQKTTGGNVLSKIVANTSDGGSGVNTIYAWTSTTADDEAVPTGTTAISYAKAAQDIPASDIKGDAAQSADNYMHIKVVDKVGNVSYAHTKYGFDSVQPEVNTFAFAKLYYGDTAASLNITYSDATSKVAYMKVTGEGVANPDTDFVAVAGTRATTLTTGDGMKGASIQVKDKAGNISVAKTCETELDTTKPTGHIALMTPGTETAKPDHSPVPEVDVRIYPTDDAITAGGFEYKLYGEGMGKSAADVEWKAFTVDAGKTYMTIAAVATGDDGAKVFEVIFKDAAGNISPAVNASFTLDRKLPEPDVQNLDFNIVSKVHNVRMSGATATTKYADEIHFDIDPGEKIVAFKVCAYATETAANAGTHEDDAIPTTAGSLNMSGTRSTASDASVQCMIKGADYEAALVAKGLKAGSTAEGAHYVLVYVQDEALNWSKSVFTA